MSDYEIFDLFFDFQVKTMYAGIESTMKKETVHLCALALSVYTEVMGGLITGKLKEEGGFSRKNYEAFLPYLGEKYVLLNKQLIERKTSLHKIVRNKLVHEFSPRASYAIMISESPQEKIGFEVNFYGNNLFNLIIHVREYYRDFKNGIEKYYKDLKYSSNQPPFTSDQTLFGNFMKSIIEN